MKIFTLFSILIFVALISCKEESKTIEYKFKEFTIEVPSFMKSIEDRNADVVAEFEVDSTINPNFILDAAIYRDDFVYEKGEKKSLKEYYKFVADDILNYNLESGSMNSAEEYKIYGNKAMIFEITGEYNHNESVEKYFFLSGVIETKKNFYEITVWTPLEYKDELKQLMNDIIFSFKEIN